MEYAFDSLPPDMRDQLVAVGRGAGIPGFRCAPLGGGGSLVAALGAAVAATAALAWRLATPATVDPLATGTVAFHGALLLPATAVAAVALGALVRRSRSPLRPCAVVTPALVVVTGAESDPVRVGRLDHVVFEKNDRDQLLLRFSDGEIAVPRVPASEPLIADLLHRLSVLHAAPPRAPVQDEWTAALELVPSGAPDPGRARLVALVVAGLLLGAPIWSGAWCLSFATREEAAWTAAEKANTPAAYAAYLEHAARNRATIPLAVRRLARADEHESLAARRQDDLAFAEAAREGKAEALGRYLRAFARGAHREEALARHEELSFQEAVSARSGLLLRALLAAYPSGRHAERARAYLAKYFLDAEKAYRLARKEWLASLLAAMRESETGVVPVIIESSYERDAKVHEALVKALGRTTAGQLVVLQRMPNQTPAPRLVVTHKLEGEAAERRLVVEIAAELPGKAAMKETVVACPPSELAGLLEGVLEDR